MIAAVGTLVSFVVIISGQRIARAQHVGNMHETWNKFNELALGNKENLEIAGWMFSTDRDTTGLNPIRIQYMGFIALNAMHAPFLGGQAGVMDKRYVNRILEHLLPPFVLKDELFALTQSWGYHPKFSLACAELRSRILGYE